MKSLGTLSAKNLFSYVAVAIALQFSLHTPPTMAADPDVIAEIEKDTIDHICSKDGWLQACYHKSGSCREIVKPFVTKCLKEVLQFAPSELELATALQYSVNSMMCFNRETKKEFGPKPKDAACEEAARHLE